MAAHGRVPLADLVYSTLRKRIIRLEIMPGSKIDVAAIASEFAASTMPVRDALKRLLERQLVVFMPGHGYRVIELTAREIEDAFEFRKLIEVSLLPKAMCAVHKRDVLSLRTQMKHLESTSLPQTQLRAEFDRLDDRLHCELIVEACGNRFARMSMEVTHDFLAIARHLNERIHESLKEHIGILDAWSAGNTEEACLLLALHLDHSLQACLPAGTLA